MLNPLAPKVMSLEAMPSWSNFHIFPSHQLALVLGFKNGNINHYFQGKKERFMLAINKGLYYTCLNKVSRLLITNNILIT